MKASAVKERTVWLMMGLLAWALATAAGHGRAETVDICVYGGTSGGIAAAVQAARMGKSVVLLEPGRHVGGMTSGGLGLTDTGNRGTIGGISREFYQRVGKRYGMAESFTFEPHVAEAVFLEMLEESQVPVRFEQRLAKVNKQGARITSVTMESGEVYEAMMFIDTTYEGDLLAMAGVSFAVGREPVSQYGETLNGIRTTTPSHQFALGVDPYRIAGNPASGLLPHVQEGDGGTPGDGDSRVQAYNFRLCLTQVETNRMPIEAPPGYDPAGYELLGRYVKARVDAGHNLTLGSFLKIDSMPRGKTDINNSGAFSTDFIGRNYTYPTNTYAERARIWKEHEDYIRGFLTFLATDSRIPASVRTSMQSWGLCKDEFQDTGGWPHQLYVREARRMIADYVITQADCDGLRVAEDSVGLASYNMDSHNCQRIVKAGAVQNEGDVQRAPTGPFPISYRAIVPRASECENLAATFCLSGTHIAFSSARMEPVFMITSQCAATAAALAIDEGLQIQHVPYSRLRLHLIAQGQVLQWGVTGPSNGIVVDSEQTTGVNVVGSWSPSTSQAGYIGSNYLHDQNAGKGTKTVQFTPDLPSSGLYNVYLRWTTNPNRATNVPLLIRYQGGTTNFTVNQQANNGVWVLLGSLPFAAGTNGSLQISTTGTDGYVIADAAMWEVPTAPSPQLIDVIASDPISSEAGLDAAVFTFIRSEATDEQTTVKFALSGSAKAGIDYGFPPGELVIPAGQLSARLTLTPRPDQETEGTESIILNLVTNAGYSLGTLTNATAVVQDSGFGAWRGRHFDAQELTNPSVSGWEADADGDSIVNLMEFFSGSDPRATNPSPAIIIRKAGAGLELVWRRAVEAADAFLRVETSNDLKTWVPAPFTAQLPGIERTGNVEALHFPLAESAPVPGQWFYRIAASLWPMPVITNRAHSFFSFDTQTDGLGSYSPTVTTNYGFLRSPTVTASGTALADAGGAAFTNFAGVQWQGSGGAAVPGHSLTFNPGSSGNQFTLTFSTSGLSRTELRMDLRSAAQAGGSAPARFATVTYDVGGGPILLDAPVIVNDGAFHEWTLSFAEVPDIDNQPQVKITWTLEDLGASPAESLRVDNLQLWCEPMPDGHLR